MSRDALLLFATGSDRPGLVDRITKVIFEVGCNLEDSRMALLGGEFALIVLVTGTVERLARLREGLPDMADELDLTVQTKPVSSTREAPTPALVYALHAVAVDHPGIVHKLSSILARHQVNVIRLDTSLSHAPLTGTPMFTLDVEAEVPEDVPVSVLRERLQEAAAVENIDLEMHAKTP